MRISSDTAATSHRGPWGGDGCVSIGLGSGGTPHIGIRAFRALRPCGSSGPLDGGLSFMDSSWDYHEGESEKRLGLALEDGDRSKAFVMSKMDGRTEKKRPASWTSH